jgi:DNA ligase (NAD+)
MKPTLAGVHHLEPMLSLDCTYDPQAVAGWVRNVNCRVFAEPKIDGVAAEAVYVDGKLESVTTRGDGITGRDITDRAHWILPEEIGTRGVLGVRGELVIPFNQFQPTWKRPDARNYVAHCTTCLDSRRLALAGAVFVAYDVVGVHEYLYLPKFKAPCHIQHPCDGIVFKVASRSTRIRLGATKRAPRWALAYKGSVDELHGLDALRDIPLPNVRL